MSLERIERAFDGRTRRRLRSAGTRRPSSGHGRVGREAERVNASQRFDHGPYGGRLSLSIARPVTITAPRKRDSGSSCRTSVDLPTPASPMIMRVCGPPCTLWSSAITSERSSFARPTKRLNTSCGDESFNAPATTHLVATVALGVEQRAVRGSEQRFERFAIFRRSGDADRKRHRHRAVRPLRAAESPARAVVRRISSANAPAPAASRPGSSTTNSSPAYRPTYWPGRSMSRTTLVTRRSASSPARCPNVSLTDLNWSTSMTSSDTCRARATTLGQHRRRHVHECAANERASEIVLLGHHHGVDRRRSDAAAFRAAPPTARSRVPRRTSSSNSWNSCGSNWRPTSRRMISMASSCEKARL